MTKTVLHIDSSARTEGSVTRDLSAQIVARLGATEVIRRDLLTPVPQLTGDWVGANFTPADDRTAEQKDLLTQSDALVAELQKADTVVIGAPIYNFSVPANLKAWIDLIARVGVTFKFGENGSEGLLEGKRAIVVIASGGTPVDSDVDFATNYLRHVLSFVGITDVQVVAADGLVMDADGSLAKAQAQIDALAA